MYIYKEKPRNWEPSAFKMATVSASVDSRCKLQTLLSTTTSPRRSRHRFFRFLQSGTLAFREDVDRSRASDDRKRKSGSLNRYDPWLEELTKEETELSIDMTGRL
ncbi:hypothetical protein K0M31_014364 [Melipona bicolor]|uniref:Uncharacterized protein n=1 Tax=Melipona bicolor TaxID=60889 RepID=A0AA40G8E9_9HYME|nr:hypothetical protein K0M31_014364 [Melipona bicolor]